MPEIGKFNKTITIELNTPIDQGAGAIDNWAELVSTKGSFKKSRGVRLLDSGAIFEDNIYELYLRQQSNIETNLSILKLRVVIDTRIYTISSIEKIDEKNFYYKFIIAEHKL